MHKRVKVCIRVRPSENSNVIVDDTSKSVQLEGFNRFQFDDVLDQNVTQNVVFDRVAQEIVESVIKGYNGCLLAYGQTGSGTHFRRKKFDQTRNEAIGKTFTMSGKTNDFSTRGICSRSISHVFQSVKNDADSSTSIRVSYVEVYNEQLYDLLDFNDTPNGKNLSVMETKSGSTFIRGLHRPLVASEEEALDFLFRGEMNRSIAEHCLNKSSTRSHCIFTIYLAKTPIGDDEQSQILSKLHLVDLAGSERMKKTGATGTVFKEATHINKSLSFLEQVVVALSDKKRDHIPYRQSLLTNILKDSLGGNCRTLMISCIWPDKTHCDQTIATLKFATRMMRVTTLATLNIVQEQSKDVEKYLKEIHHLKRELALHDTLAGRSRVSYSEVTDDEKKHIDNMVDEYLADTSMNIPIPITSIRRIEYTFASFRRRIHQFNSSQISHVPDVQCLEERKEAGNNSKESKPTTAILPDKIIHDQQHGDSLKDRAAKIDPIALEQFKQTEIGAPLFERYDLSKKNFKLVRSKAKRAAADVNGVKREIDNLIKLTADDTALQTQKLDELKAAKQQYRTYYEIHKEMQSEVSFMEKSKHSCFDTLVTSFQSWQESNSIK